jgi:DNA helicase-2/ATP-dependent DNA helicase PcrA
VPEADRRHAIGVQLAVYRLAWAALSGTPPEKVRAAFHYVREAVTLRPADLQSEEELVEMVRSLPRAPRARGQGATDGSAAGTDPSDTP